MLNTLIIKFNNAINYNEIPLFRGAVIGAIGSECNELFHNHRGDGYRYSYPMIQYKRIRGCAAIVCVGQGTEVIGAFFNTGHFIFKLGELREEKFVIDMIKTRRTEVQVWDEDFRYTLRDWLPFNSENYHRYIVCEGIVERTSLLEQIWVGNVLSMCKGLGISVEREIKCKIVSLNEPRKVYYKGVPMMSFSCELTSNITLPDHIGIGKGASMGHGIIVRQRRMNNEKQ